MRIIAQNIMKLRTLKTFSAGSFFKKNRSNFSLEKQKFMFMENAYLEVRNSDTLVLKLQKVDLTQSRKSELVQIQVAPKDTLKQLTLLIQEQLNIQNCQFFCQNGFPISSSTPIEVFLNRTLVMTNSEAGIKIYINGQLSIVIKQDLKIKFKEQLKENLRQLELPVIAQREIQAYFNRVDSWLDSRLGTQSKQSKMKLKQAEVNDILIQSIVDPKCLWNQVLNIQKQWFALYMQIRELRQKKDKAAKMSEVMATKTMYLGVGLLTANIAFIWSGTYYFYSWDIIEPIAYFTSSLANIVLFSQIFRINKPFSLQNYRRYLIQKNMPIAAQKIGLNLLQLEQKEVQLSILQVFIKDSLIAKL